MASLHSTESQSSQGSALADFANQKTVATLAPPYPVTLGLEEEVFAIEKDRNTPSFQSFDYLRKVWYFDPRDGIGRTASNLAKGSDRRSCVMGSIEVSTSKCSSPQSLIEDLVRRRKRLAKSALHALVVPIGALPDCPTPSNTASSHIHIGVPKEERERVYDNLAYFLPLIGVASACSPVCDGSHIGLSYRLANASLLGQLKDDKEFRFQDMIVSKRLGTIEIRLLDPIPEIDRLISILQVLVDIASWEGHIPLNRQEYNDLRPKWTSKGFIPELQSRWQKLQEISDFDFKWIQNPLSSRLNAMASSSQIFEELDRIWRLPTGTNALPKPTSKMGEVKGILAYYIPKLPFMAVKGYREWYGRTP